MPIYENGMHFSKRKLADSLRIWNSATISLLDIRHNLISPQHAMRGYRLPASAFLYTGPTKAEVLLGETSYDVEKYGLFHGMKGSEVSILPVDDWLEYYIVLYRAVEPPFHKREFFRLLEHVNPFHQQYGLTPPNPLFFMEHLRKMYELWKNPVPLNLFYGKTAFYQLVYAVYAALEQEKVHVFEADTITMAQEYLGRHFNEPISIGELCGMLGVSYSSFYRNFKKKTGLTPQEYLIDTRLHAAKERLLNSSASIREVAEHCGFPDEHNFYRLFIRHFGVSPNVYRQISHTRLKDDTIGKATPFLYNGESQVRLDELEGKGAFSMFKQMGNRAILAAVLSLMLLLSACGTSPTNTGGAEGGTTSALSSQVTKTEATEPAEEGTRTISTVMGDIEVPINPERVVVNWYIGDVLSAGLNVVGYNCWSHETMPFYEQMTATTQIENWEPEDVMQLEPDLIITYKTEDFEKFNKIAPVLVIEEKVSAPERTRIIGEATGHSEMANKNVETFEAKLAAAKEIFQAEAFEGKTFSIMQDWGSTGDWSGVAYETGSRGGTLVYKYLGLKYPDKLAELLESNGDGRNTLSYEVAHEYFGDYILWFQQEGTESEYAKTDIWQSIPAVAEGRLLEIPGEYMGLFFFSDVLSLTAQLDYLVDALNELVV